MLYKFLLDQRILKYFQIRQIFYLQKHTTYFFLEIARVALIINISFHEGEKWKTNMHFNPSYILKFLPFAENIL